MSSLEMRAFWHGMDQARYEDRVAAFGAIRRAAEVARDADRTAEKLWNEIGDPWENSDAIVVLRAAAAGCRDAIRAAIGSEKT